MTLKTIADNAKQNAKNHPGMEMGCRLPSGARLKIKYNADPELPYEFRVQVQRAGKLPVKGTEACRKWETELATFARYFGAPESAEWTMQVGTQTYAAFLSWFDEDAMQRDYEEWAYAISQRAKPIVTIDENDPIAKAVGILPTKIMIPSTDGDTK